MGKHDIIFPALQKYYSALKSLNDFGQSGNFFADVSSLDTFFSEFRNITFVIQKGLKTIENKKIYKDNRDNKHYKYNYNFFLRINWNNFSIFEN